MKSGHSFFDYVFNFDHSSNIISEIRDIRPSEQAIMTLFLSLNKREGSIKIGEYHTGNGLLS